VELPANVVVWLVGRAVPVVVFQEIGGAAVVLLPPDRDKDRISVQTYFTLFLNTKVHSGDWVLKGWREVEVGF
jgi:hypothetical protein